MKNFLKSKKNTSSPRGWPNGLPRGGGKILLAILLLALFLRLYGINWDQNQHLHPDERFLTMVTQVVKWPTSWPQYLNPKTSPLNPYNAGHGFFVYGTLPLKIVKFFSGIITFDKFDYNNISLVGRFVSALFDVGIVYLVYKIAEKIFNKKIGLLASFLYTISVLPIQLSHFYAVDTFLVFFLTLSFYLTILLIGRCHPGSFDYVQDKLHRRSSMGFSRRFAPQNDMGIPISSGLLGVSFGLALACKISALYFLPIILLGFLFRSLKKERWVLSFSHLLPTIYHLLIFIFCSYFTFRFADPRAFATNNLINPTLNSQFVVNIKQLKSFNDPNGFFPPAIQWMSTKLIIFPLKNMILWGLGIPLGILTLAGVTFSLSTQIKHLRTGTLFKNTNKGDSLDGGNFFKEKNVLLQRKKQFNSLPAGKAGSTVQQFCKFLILFWILLLFFYQGSQFVKAMRYFYPIYPFLAILSANFLRKLFLDIKGYLQPSAYYSLSTIYYLLLFLWPLSFLSIYSQPHPRVTASEWIYQNIPPGSTISCEHWDDCLPLSLLNKNSQTYRYKTETLELYNPDTQTKWQKINAQLENVDYLIMSSNRLWGSIPKVPEKYPITAKFYEDLFAEKLQWTKVVEIASYPGLTINHWPLIINDSSADESFTVYDHPKILIYRKN